MVFQSYLDCGVISEWMGKERTKFIQKYKTKVMGDSSYRPAAFLSLMWTPLSRIFSEKLHMHNSCVLADEQKGCRRKISWKAKDQLLIDKAILREVRKKDKFC